MKHSLPGENVRRFLVLAALMVVAAPLQAQKKRKPDPYKITAEELAEFGSASVGEVVQRVRPNFYIFTPASDAGLNLSTVTGVQYGIVVFNGSQQLGDTSMLRF